MKDRITLYNIPETQQRGNCLGNYRGIGAALHTHMKINNEYNVQDHVNDTGYDQEVEGRLGIAERAQKSGQCIVGNCNNETCVDDSHVCCDIRQQIFRRVHHPQNGFVGDQKTGSHDQGKGGGQVYGHSYIVPHEVITFCAEPLGDQNGKTAGKSVEPACDKKHQRAGAADGGQSVDAEKLSCHNGIRNIIELLKNISQAYGES